LTYIAYFRVNRPKIKKNIVAEASKNLFNDFIKNFKRGLNGR
tara:strand:- start:261 stop:386 length:126 start_codon:yes stop_codon:yes gene_type:complete